MVMTHTKLPPAPGKRGLIFIILLILLTIVGGCFSQTEMSEQASSAGADPSHPIEITDSWGQNISLPGPAKRIVCLNAAANEILINIGAGDTVVGVADFIVADNHPNMRMRLSNAATVGELTRPDIEKILSLHPDVLIAYSNRPQNFDSMVAANITVVSVTSYKPLELIRDAETLGRLSGHEAGAERYIRFTERYLTLINNRLHNVTEEERPRVYIEYVNDFSAYGPGSGGDRLVTLLRAKNIAANLTGQQVLVSREWVLQEDPDTIIKTIAPMKANFSEVRSTVIARPGFADLQAVKNNRVYCMSTGVITTPRSVVGLLYAAKALYPGRFADINPDEVYQEYFREFGTGDDETEVFYPMDPIQAGQQVNRV
jgi:iron complex transport system substrate-binding protein